MKRCLICGLPLDNNEVSYHAKCTRSLFHSSAIPVFNYSQSELNELAKAIIQQRISVPGVQPKLSLHLERGGSESQGRLTLVGLEGNYILKPQTPQWPHLPEAEHFAMLLARLCKISTAEFALIALKSGELAYISRRMDRTKDGPLHMEDFCQLSNKMTSQKYHGSMEQVGKALRKYSNLPGLDAVRLFELTVFCYLIGNSDMHLKNFSLLRQKNGQYTLSPAYDLVPVNIILPADKEEMALSICGKKANLKKSDFVSFSENLGLTTAQQEKTLARLLAYAEKYFPAALQRSFLPLKMQKECQDLFQSRLSRIVRRGRSA
jgi:serine/threonine-protein kinase HipA